VFDAYVDAGSDNKAISEDRRRGAGVSILHIYREASVGAAEGHGVHIGDRRLFGIAVGEKV
jgi:hypothetical protein